MVKKFNRPLHVVHVNYGNTSRDSANGVDKTVYYLASELSAYWRVTIIDLLPQNAPLGKKWNNEKFDRISFHSSGLRFSIPWGALKFFLVEKPDLVHLHSVFIPEMFALSRVLRMMKIPYLVTPNGGYQKGAMQRSRTKKKIYMALFESKLLRGASGIHLVSKNEYDSMSLWNDKRKLHMVENGIDLSELPKNVRRDYWHERFPQTRRSKILLFLGRLDIEHKGLDLFIRGFIQAKKKLSSRLVSIIVGPEKNGAKQKLREIVHGSQYEDDVIFCRPIYGDDKWHAIGSADWFVHTSRWEGFPLAVVEALALGVPCLVSEQTNTDYLIREFGAGLVVRANDNDIARAIVRLDETPREILAERSRFLVSERLQWNQIGKRMVKVYQAIVRQ